MESNEAVAALSALAHPHRLAVFRLLMARGAEGLTAGELAGQLGLPPSSLAFHTAQLQRSGLLHARRVQRHVFYSVDIAGTRDLLRFLSEDCCQGHPEICGFVSDDTAANCCEPSAAAATRGR